jgi:hypothetical protein
VLPFSLAPIRRAENLVPPLTASTAIIRQTKYAGKMISRRKGQSRILQGIKILLKFEVTGWKQRRLTRGERPDKFLMEKFIWF